MKGKRLLILGSGFSKAIFCNMPIVKELAQYLEQEKALQQDPYDKLVDDPELLLSYLSLNQPWKEPPKALEDEALFARVQKDLAEFITDCEDHAFKNSIPDWAKRLVEYLHSDKISVITFNYDTVLERIVYKIKQQKGKSEGKWPREFHLYGLPLSVIWSREGATLMGIGVETFHLIKLHGSINWFYSGVEGFPGEQVYYRPIVSDSPREDVRKHPPTAEYENIRLRKDKISLIIPPVAEKSFFYGNLTVRTLWTDARRALEEAEEIFCVGYSLPSTDLTTKLFLRSVARPKKVIIVNKESPDGEKGQGMLKRYQEAFPGAEIDGRTFTGNGSVEKMTEYLINSGRTTDRSCGGGAA